MNYSFQVSFYYKQLKAELCKKQKKFFRLSSSNHSFEIWQKKSLTTISYYDTNSICINMNEKNCVLWIFSIFFIFL